MKRVLKITAVFVVFILLAGGFVFLKKSAEPSLKPTEKPLSPKIMNIVSPVFENNRFIPEKYTCDGEDISPPLRISGVPQGAKSLVLIVDDPDAPAKTWVHWLVWNIDSSTALVEEGQRPAGAVEGLNDFGKPSYGGPCPPSGIHHYHFKLYALDKILDLDSSSRKEELEKAMGDSILDRAEIVGLYQRKNKR